MTHSDLIDTDIPGICYLFTTIVLITGNYTELNYCCKILWLCARFHVCVLSLQPYLTLCNPTDCNLPGSSVHEIVQPRIFEWVAMPYFIWSSQPMGQTCGSCDCIAGGFFYLLSHLGSPQNIMIVLPVVRVPGQERRLLETMQLAIGEFITASSHGLPPSPRVWGQKAPSPSSLGYLLGQKKKKKAAGSWHKRIGYTVSRQFFLGPTWGF